MTLNIISSHYLPNEFNTLVFSFLSFDFNNLEENHENEVLKVSEIDLYKFSTQVFLINSSNAKLNYTSIDKEIKTKF